MDFALYDTTLAAAAAMAALMLLQLLVADIIGIRRKHEPGTPVPASHDDVLFRTTRAVGNTNESIAIFILLVVLAMFSGASPQLTAIASWVYVIGRLAYTLCYYFDVRIMRSVFFGVALLALVALLVIAVFF